MLVILMLAFDQLTKQWARQQLKDHPPISWWKDSVRLQYVENTGAFLSMGDDWSPTMSFWLLNIVPLIFLMVLFIYALRTSFKTSVRQVIPLLMIFAGGLGNIIDRIVYDRHVTDFMNVGIGRLRTGIFNVADLFVTTGVVLIFFGQWKKPKAAIDGQNSTAVD